MASLRAKTMIACDTCRKRKSRCDGLRPTCTHCQDHSIECTYRPSLVSQDGNSAILARLEEVEARIAAIEGHSPWHNTIPPSSRGIDGGIDIETSAFTRPPNLHTAASYRMLDGWPKLRLHIPPMHVRAMEYLQEADSSDGLLIGALGNSHGSTHEISAIQALHAIETVHQRIHELPPALACLVMCSPKFSLESTTPVSLRESSALSLELRNLALEQLLLLSIGLRYSSREEMAPSGATLSELCFLLCMERSWLLHSNPAEDSLGTLLVMAVCLESFWGRPFHSLGLLQSIDPHIHNRLAVGNRSNEERLKLYAMIHRILEGDILTELDGFPSRSVDGLNCNIEALSNSDSVHHGPREMWEILFFLESNLKLKNCLNGILHELYSPEKANAAPHDIADLVEGNAKKLRQWYRSLPFEQQFAKDIATFKIGEQVLSLRQRELALRYYACVFLLHRPVLYFFLHKDMEYSIRPPDPAVINLDNVPWVYESCRDCIEAAALIIYMHRMRLDVGSEVERSYYSWCDMQMLFAAYLIIVQLKSAPILRVVLDGNEIDRLLNIVEDVFERVPFESVVVKTSLMLLRKERQGFEASL